MQIDPRGGWADEARKHLDTVKQKLQNKHASFLISPKDPLAANNYSESLSSSRVRQAPELYQEAALQSWLPRAIQNDQSSRISPGEARRLLDALANTLAVDHDDPWLQTFLQFVLTTNSNTALWNLLASDKAVHSGRYSEGIALAQQAVDGFASLHDEAGVARALMAEMVAQDSALDHSDCIRTARQLFPLLAQTRFHWLQAAAFIEQGQCFYGTAQMHEAAVSNLDGRKLAKEFHYTELELRATAFGASYLLNSGNPEQGMEDLRSGLATFWQSYVSADPGENLYSCLFNASDGIKWPFVDAYAIKELLNTFASSDPVDQAVEKELLAGAQARAGDSQAAQETLQNLKASLATLPNDNAMMLRKVEILIEAADLHLRMGDADSAIKDLAPFREAMGFNVVGGLRAEYFKILGEAYLRKGNLSEAEPLLMNALNVRETGLKSLRLRKRKACMDPRKE